MKILETERLELRRLTPVDAPFILELLNDPLFLRFVGDKGARTVDDARAYLVNGPIASYAQHGFGLFLVSLKADGTPLGMCGLLKRPVLEDVDVGFGFLTRHGGHGYATEAAAACRDYARTALGASRLIAIIHPDNRPSQRVAEKIGLRPEKRSLVHGGREAVIYAGAL